MVAQRLPQVGIIDQRYVFCWPPTGKTVSRGLLARTSPAFITAEAKINLSVDNAFAIIDILLNRAIRVNDTAPAAKLYAALQAITVSSEQVHSILEGARYPPLTGHFSSSQLVGKSKTSAPRKAARRLASKNSASMQMSPARRPIGVSQTGKPRSPSRAQRGSAI